MRRLAGGWHFSLRAFGVVQALALTGCALAICWGRIREPRGGIPRASAEARRLARTLGALKGPFAKVGQFAALRLDALPSELRQGLSGLRDRVPPLPFDWIRQCVERELGGRLEDHFASFDPQPLGAASIAQVHRARLWADGPASIPGREVAVKVQYPWLARSLPADLGLLRLIVRASGRGPRDARARRRQLFEEFASGVAEELDFRREARVASEIAANLSGDPQLVVPEVVTSHSTGRILTVVYHPTLSITDRHGLEARGIDPAEVLAILARAYAQQVFVDGLFHADPHPGNLFVLDEPDAARKPRVLFVDFGLSKRLAPELRGEMRRAIYALLQSDLEAFVEGMGRLDMIAAGAEPEVRAAVGAMFERLRGEQGGPLAMGPGRVLSLKDEAKRLLEQTPGLQLPNDLLLYAKTLSYLFGLGAELAPEVDLMKLSVPYLLRFLAAKDAAS